MKKTKFTAFLLIVFSISIKAQTNIFPATGNVGIGTTTPGSKLVVNGKARIISNLAIGADEDGPDFFPLYIKNPGSSSIGFNVSGQPTDQRIWCVLANGNAFRILTENDAYTAIQDALIISRSGININSVIFPNGNFGIGTTDTKGYKLAVNGSAIFTKAVVKLNSAWPDYVFDKDYQLLSLDSVANFIAVNKHLPGVPDADDINKSGIDLGENQKILLQKTEELTLYTIQQNKIINKQNDQIQSLEIKLKDLEGKL